MSWIARFDVRGAELEKLARIVVGRQTSRKFRSPANQRETPF